MARGAVFRWHEAAQLFAGETRIARPPASGPLGFQAIANIPTHACLPALAKTLAAGGSFCVSQDPLPKGVRADPATFLTLTGGSTAAPKIIRRSMASWIASVEVNAQQFNLIPKDSLAVLGALSHSLALYGVVEGAYLGLNTHVLAALPAKTQANVLRQQRISVLYATPTQLRLLTRGARPLPDLRLILCGGGALDPVTAQTIQDLCPNAVLHQFYGAAETSFITMTDAMTPQGAQGQPYPGVTLRILDETGAETTGIGEVWVRSPYLFDGYATETTVAQTHDGFVSVGEIGHLDPRGNLYLTGRKSRRVSIADQTVYPDAIETHLMALPQMPPCAVLPVNDALRGQRLTVVIEGMPDQTLAQKARSSCRERFGSLATPARVLFIDTLPLLPSGKADLSALALWLEDQT